MLSLAALPLLLSFAAPDLGAYKLEPWRDINPFWSDPLEDSLKTGGAVTTFGERHLPNGAISGRDTSRIESRNGILHGASVYWKGDSIRSVRHSWQISWDGRVDSMTDETFRRDSSTYWTQSGAFKIPGGVASWVNYGPNRTSRVRIDSFFTYFDANGRIVATRTIRPFSGSDTSMIRHWGKISSVKTDSVTWSDAGIPVRWSIFDSTCWSSSGFTVTRETHILTWDGFRLIRDSTTTTTRNPGESTKRDSSTSVFSWDGPRLLGYATWNAKGLPLTRTGNRTTFWSWDSLGRMTRLREWGTETDLDSLFYGTGPWPERRHSYTCSNKSPYVYDIASGTAVPTIDQCVLKESILYTYTIEKALSVGERQVLRPTLRASRATIEVSGLSPEARTALLLDPSGSILRRATVSKGTASLAVPKQAGVGLWVVLDAKGKAIVSGRVPLP